MPCAHAYLREAGVGARFKALDDLPPWAARRSSLGETRATLGRVHAARAGHKLLIRPSRMYARASRMGGSLLTPRRDFAYHPRAHFHVKTSLSPIPAKTAIRAAEPAARLTLRFALSWPHRIARMGAAIITSCPQCMRTGRRDPDFVQAVDGAASRPSAKSPALSSRSRS